VFTPLEWLADAVVKAGVREIRGGVAGDESRYDTQRYVPTWSSSYASQGAIGPVSALTVNDGFQGFAGVGARRVAAPFPASHAAAVFTSLLRARGVVVGGQPGEGVAPETATQVVGSVESPPLREVVAEMLRESDNMTAELLTKELGKRFGGGGTWSAGIGVVRSTVGEIGLPVAGFAAADGSGLDRGDRISCSMLMAAIDLEKAALVPAFAVAGETGTLSRRFLGNPAAGKLRAKTGTLNFVSGLVGVVEPTSGALLEFALLANELPDRIASGEVLQERVGAALARYPEAPPIEELGPR
jgi:D-alanyl-D-alanine carboxypeptidase/D-alanyl-D-alanine-endopeptidase (penicillin-binding protein 4)